MTTRRMIASDIWRDDFFGSLDFMGQLLWIGLITCADDQGRMWYKPALIKSDIFPLSDIVTTADIEKRIAQFSKEGKALVYKVGEKEYLQIVKWWSYQTPSWASPSKFPPPLNWTDKCRFHISGNKVETRNWDRSGGFNGETLKLPLRLSCPVGSDLPSDIASLYGEGEGEGEGEFAPKNGAEISEAQEPEQNQDNVINLQPTEENVIPLVAVMESPEGYFDKLEEKRNGNKQKTARSAAEMTAATVEAMARGAVRDFDLKEAACKECNTNFNWDTKGGKAFIAFLKARPEGETIARFMSWWKLNDWRGKQGQMPTMGQVQEVWPQAFKEPEFKARGDLKHGVYV